MDIHKPKPWHGWREFLKEYGIIVLGVLTALGAEQVVEGLHWRERTQLADENLRANLSVAAGPVQSGVILQPCETEMLGRLEQALLATGEDWRPPYIIHVGSQSAVLVEPTYMLGAEVWHDAQADGTANHFPSHRQQLYGDAYDRLAQLQASNDDASMAIAELNSLSAPRRIDPQSRTSYLRLIYRIRDHINVTAERGSYFIHAAKALGVTIPDPAQDGILKGIQRMCAGVHAGQTDVTVN